MWLAQCSNQSFPSLLSPDLYSRHLPYSAKLLAACLLSLSFPLRHWHLPSTPPLPWNCLAKVMNEYWIPNPASFPAHRFLSRLQGTWLRQPLWPSGGALSPWSLGPASLPTPAGPPGGPVPKWCCSLPRIFPCRLLFLLQTLSSWPVLPSQTANSRAGLETRAADPCL